MKSKLIIFVLLVVALQGCRNEDKSTSNGNETPPIANVENIAFTLKGTFPHDTLSFTEGFLVHEGQFLESTGSPDDRPKAESQFGILNTKTGKLDVKAKLDKSVYFGEGIVVLKDKLYQVTYKNQQGFIYDAKSYKKLGDFKYANPEGWGLTTDGTSIIMSDGSSSLTYLDPNNLQPTKTLTIKKYGEPITMINELEYINGFIYANIWLTNEIIKIDAATGNVVGSLDLTPINSVEKTDNPRAMEMNGIAYDAATKKLYITGKMWSKVYEIALN